MPVPGVVREYSILPGMEHDHRLGENGPQLSNMFHTSRGECWGAATLATAITLGFQLEYIGFNRRAKYAVVSVLLSSTTAVR